MESNKRRQNGKEKKRIDLRSRKTLIIIGSVVVLGIIFLVSVGAVFANKKDDKNDILNFSVTGTDSKIEVTGIVVDPTSLDMEVGAEAQLTITIEPVDATYQSVTYTSDNGNVATVDENGKVTAVGAGSCNISIVSTSNESVVVNIGVNVKEKAKVETSSDGLTYIGGILVVNKSYALPSTYNPGLSAEAMNAFYAMQSAAANEGLNLFIVSGFRSYSTQASLYNSYVASYGQASADTFSARPGHSEHQSGLAIDVNSADSSFEGTAEAIWLANNSYKYGFIIRYPKGKESITGYMYEPWHLRYLGVATATAVYNSGLTLEEYLGIDSSYK